MPGRTTSTAVVGIGHSYSSHLSVRGRGWGHRVASYETGVYCYVTTMMCRYLRLRRPSHHKVAGDRGPVVPVCPLGHPAVADSRRHASSGVAVVIGHPPPYSADPPGLLTVARTTRSRPALADDREDAPSRARCRRQGGRAVWSTNTRRAPPSTVALPAQRPQTRRSRLAGSGLRGSESTDSTRRSTSPGCSHSASTPVSLGGAPPHA
jgi:hypothetical protein